MCCRDAPFYQDRREAVRFELGGKARANCAGTDDAPGVSSLHLPARVCLRPWLRRELYRPIERKWKIIVICQLFGAKGLLRFSELEKRTEGVNQKMLIQQLKEL